MDTKRYRKIFLISYFSGLVLVPLVLVLLPADFFDKGRSVCLSVLLLDIQCLGCGITRAIQHLLHFDVEAAADYNKLSFVVLPVLLFVWFRELRRTYQKIKT